MVDEHRLGLCVEAPEPAQQTCLVGVAGGSVQGGDFGIDGDLFTEELHGLGTVLELTAQGILRLIANEQDHTLRPPQIVLQVVPDTARFAHAAGGEDHLGGPVEIDGLGLIGGDTQGHAGRPDGVISRLEHRAGLRVQTAYVTLEENARGFHRQGGVHIHGEIRMARDQALLLDLPDGIEHLLGTTHGEGGNDHIAAPVKSPLDVHSQLAHSIAPLTGVVAVAVGGFQHQVVRLRHLLGVVDNRLVLVAHVAGEGDFSRLLPFRQPQLDGGGAKEVTDIRQPEGDALAYPDHFTVVAPAELVQRAFRIRQGIGGLHHRGAGALRLPVAPLSFGLLDVGGVPEHDIAEVAGGVGGVDGALEAVLVQLGDHAGVVDMGMGQKYRLNLVGADGKGDILEHIGTLLHAAVHHVILAANFQQCAAAGNLVGSADKLNFHSEIAS